MTMQPKLWGWSCNACPEKHHHPMRSRQRAWEDAMRRHGRHSFVVLEVHDAK